VPVCILWSFQVLLTIFPDIGKAPFHYACRVIPAVLRSEVARRCGRAGVVPSRETPCGIVVVCEGAFEVERSCSQLVDPDHDLVKRVSWYPNHRHACNIAE
jgi:hypothetical protein